MASGGRSQLKMSEETFDFVCTSCAEDNKTAEAVKYCAECGGYCCQSCTDAHKKFPALRNHNLLDVNEGKQASGQPSCLPEFPTERCSIHKGKTLDMYCEGHDVVGCYVCIAKDHKSCQDGHIHSIPDVIDTLFKLSDCKQTHRLLTDMMVSTQAQSKSKDVQLQKLVQAKEESLIKVNAFQKALEAMLTKIAESTRKEVDAVYKQLEKEILQQKHIVDSICDGLQKTDDKLTRSEGNRAQRFVCTRIAHEQIKEADSEKIRQGLQYDMDVQISFIQDQSLVEYIQALQGIGQVQKHGEQKHDLYKIKGKRDISMKLSHDSYPGCSFGCCLTHDNQLLVTDRNNKKLKRVDIQKMSVVDYCTIDSVPDGVCCISKHEVAVACKRDNKIQFVSIYDKMTSIRQIKMPHRCYSIAFNDGKLYVTDSVESLHVYDMTGAQLKTIVKDKAGNNLFSDSRHITFNKSRSRMFVGTGHFQGIACFDGVGTYLSTFANTDLTYADGVCVDGRGNMFVVGYSSRNVVQYSENGKKLGVVVKQGDGLQDPRSVCFHQGLNRMFVTTDCDVVQMFELE